MTPIIGTLSNPVEWKGEAYGRESFRRRAAIARLIGVDLLEIVLSSANVANVVHRREVDSLRWDGESLVPARVRYDDILVIDDSYFSGAETGGRENDARYRAIRNALHGGQKPFVNHPDLGSILADKWKLYEVMRACHIRTPETYLYEITALSHLLETPSLVFIKPRAGSQGARQIVIERRAGGYHVDDDHRHVHCSTDAGLADFLEGRHLTTHWIAQAGVRAHRLAGRVVDLRTILQRGPDGAMLETATYLRQGADGSFQANISSGGGAVHDPADVLPNWAGIHSRVRSLSRSVVRALENATGYPAGEIGTDIVVADDGALWFIEANIHIGRRGLVDLAARENGQWARVLRRNIRRPLEYAKYIADREGLPDVSERL